MHLLYLQALKIANSLHSRKEKAKAVTKKHIFYCRSLENFVVLHVWVPLGSPIRKRVFDLTCQLWVSGISVYVTKTKQDTNILKRSLVQQ